MWQAQRAAKADERDDVVRAKTQAFVSQEPCLSREVVVGAALPKATKAYERTLVGAAQRSMYSSESSAAALWLGEQPSQGEAAEITLKLEPLERGSEREMPDRGLALILVAVTLLAMAAIAVSAVPASEPVSTSAGAARAHANLEHAPALSPSVEADLGMPVGSADPGATPADPGAAPASLGALPTDPGATPAHLGASEGATSEHGDKESEP